MTVSNISNIFIHTIWRPFLVSFMFALLICPSFIISYYKPYLIFYETCDIDDNNLVVCENLIKNSNESYFIFYLCNLVCFVIYITIHGMFLGMSNEENIAYYEKNDGFTVIGVIISYMILNISTYYCKREMMNIMFMILSGLITPYIISTFICGIYYIYNKLTNKQKTE